MEDEETLQVYGVQEGKLYLSLMTAEVKHYFRGYHQHRDETLRRQKEEEEEGLHQAQENKAQAQKAIQGPPGVLQRGQHRKDLQA